MTPDIFIEGHRPAFVSAKKRLVLPTPALFLFH